MWLVDHLWAPAKAGLGFASVSHILAPERAKIETEIQTERWESELSVMNVRKAGFKTTDRKHYFFFSFKTTGYPF